MSIFSLRDFEFIELNKLLKILNWVNSGGQANLVITDGEVLVNGGVETRKRKKLRKGDVVELWENKVTIAE